MRAHAARERHLDEDDRLLGKLGMEEREAAPVRLEAPAQVAPALDRVHRLVLDQLLEHDGRGAPVDALQAQEPAVEPRAQQVHEVVVDDAPLRMRLHALQELLADRHERRGASGRHVEAAKELLARRLDDLLEARELLRRWIGLIVGCDARDRLGRGRVVARQRVEELLALALLERLVGRERLACKRGARVLAALGEQRVAQREQVPNPPLYAALASPEQLPQEGGRVHAAALASASMRAASSPATRSRSSRYFSRTPRVLFTVSGSSATRSSATRQFAQSMVSATPGCLKRSLCRSRCTNATTSRDRRSAARGALRRRISSSRFASG